MVLKKRKGKNNVASESKTITKCKTDCDNEVLKLMLQTYGRQDSMINNCVANVNSGLTLRIHEGFKRKDELTLNFDVLVKKFTK